MKYLLDTNICIYIIKNKPASVIKHFKKCDLDDIAISTITIAELEYGVYKSQKIEQNTGALQKFLLPFSFVEFNTNAAIEYGKLRALLEKRGQVIGAMDLLIASIALANKLILVSNNTNEFERVPNIELVNWAK